MEATRERYRSVWASANKRKAGRAGTAQRSEFDKDFSSSWRAERGNIYRLYTLVRTLERGISSGKITGSAAVRKIESLTDDELALYNATTPNTRKLTKANTRRFFGDIMRINTLRGAFWRSGVIVENWNERLAA